MRWNGGPNLETTTNEDVRMGMDGPKPRVTFFGKQHSFDSYFDVYHGTRVLIRRKEFGGGCEYRQYKIFICHQHDVILQMQH